MNDILNEKMVMVIKLLISYPFIGANEISEEMKISRRSTYYIIDEINQLLDSNHHNYIDSVYGKGFHLTENQRIFLSSAIFNDSNNYIESLERSERIACIYIDIFLGHRKNIGSFENVFEVSKFTVVNDIAELRQDLKLYNVNLISNVEGYCLKGNIHNLRKAYLYFFSFIYQLITNDSRIIRSCKYITPYVSQKMKIIHNFEISNDVKYYDPILLALVCLSEQMLTQEKAISLKEVEDAFPIINNRLERSLFDEIASQLPNSEREYLANYLAYSRIDLQIKSNKNSKDITNKFCNAIYSVTGVKITDNDLIEKLTNHFELAYIRYTLGIPVDNPMISQIKKEYRTYFNIVKQAIDTLNDSIGGLINDNEIGFLTLYIAGYFRNRKPVSEQVKVIIVCLHGLSTSYLLKKEIENLDNRLKVIATMSEYGIRQFNEDYDLLISTISLDWLKKDYLLVNPILSIDDKSNILDSLNLILDRNKSITYTNVIDAIKPYIAEDNIEYVKHDLKELYQCYTDDVYYSLDKIIIPSFVDIFDTEAAEMDWKEILTFATKPLENNNYILKSFKDELIANIEEYGSYMVYPNGYLLGHASMDESKRLGLSFLKLKKEIEIYGNKVKNILIFSPIDSTTHIQLLNKLFKMFHDEKFNNDLENISDRNDLYRIILKYLS